MSRAHGAGVPRISIVTPTHNRRAALLRAIASVRAQTVEDFEHIVVDDGSTDGTGEAVAALGDPRIVYIAMAAWGGANAARNIGIARARAPVVTFLDSDDAFLPDRLETSLAHFDDDPQLHLLISSFRKHKADSVASGTNPPCSISASDLELVLMAQTIYIAGSSITARKDALQEIDGFDPEVMRLQDRDLLLRMSRHHGALLSAHVDWIKYETAGSISGRPDGYVEAYGELLRRHPRISQRFPAIGPYMIARRIFANFINGRVRLAVADYRANRASPLLGFTSRQLVVGYIGGKAVRRHARITLAKAGRGAAPTAPGTPVAAGVQAAGPPAATDGSSGVPTARPV